MGLVTSPAPGESLRCIARLMSRAAARLSLRRSEVPVLLFFHGYALAHTIRPLVLARALRDRGYPVVLAGRGPHVVRVREAGFDVRDIETLPQCRMDQFVARGDYRYYDMEWVDRCVRSERMLIQMVKPALVIHEMKPTVHLSARLEGVDDARITQGYNHPAYAHRLPLVGGFDVESGPFDDYLALHAGQVQPQSSFYLLADLPQLHPPRRDAAGFHFVGPLLEHAPEPASLAVLDEGWDTSLPLVYVTTGSSGRPPDYLPSLVEALRSKPYRVIVTTAGRWQPGDCVRAYTIPPNVRVVPFLNGEWILRRAEMLVGVVGIGAICQALGQGKPVIGAPEHLDQEYHLNRIRDLGLGIKIDRARFDAAHITAAIGEVMARREEFRQRCAPFREHLAAFPDGGRAADLIDSHFTQRSHRYQVSSSTLVGGEEFVRYLDATTPAELDAARLRKMVLRGVRRGMPHRWVGRGLCFDRCDSWNWLYDNDPDFFQADYRACQERRERFLLEVEGGPVRARHSWQRYRLTYRLRLHPRASDGTPQLAAGERVKLFLPYPIRRPGHQGKVRLTGITPAAFEPFLTPDLGFVYGPTVAVTDPDEPIEVGYSCEVSVRALRLEDFAFKTELTEEARARCLELDGRILQLPEVVRLRRELDLGSRRGAEAKARAIYRALAATRRFKKTRDPTTSPLYSTTTILRSDGGHCTTLARAFASLCRAEGIPTREVTGALLGYPVGDGAFELRSFGEPLFGHTWAEIHLAGRGWIPVEFHGIAVGAQSLTKKNATDRPLRRQIEARTAPYLDYYFGNLDPHRILGSPSVKRMPLMMTTEPNPAPGQRPWTARYDLSFECLLRAECLQG